MTKIIKMPMYIGDNIRCVGDVNNTLNCIQKEIETAKQELFGLIMSTPNGVTPHGKDVVEYMQSKFDDILYKLWDNIREDYVYSMVLEDIETNPNSEIREFFEQEGDNIQGIM